MAIKEQDKVFYEEAENGDKIINLPITRANNVEGLGRSANAAYVVGDVVYVDSNKKVALKCVTAGTTSSSELDVSTKAIGSIVTDGGVVWKVCNRTSDVTSVNGQTGDVVVGKIVDATISGKVITLTFADGTTKTLITQDTVGITTNKVPNYNAGISHSVVANQEITFTCPADGVIVVDMFAYGKTSIWVKINDVFMFNNPSVENIALKGTGQYIVKQGDVVKFKETYAYPGYYALDTVVFYPYR